MILIAPPQIALQDIHQENPGTRKMNEGYNYSEFNVSLNEFQGKFKEGLMKAGPQAVADFQRMLKAAGSSRNAPSEDVGPRIPGTFDRTEEES